MAMQKNWLGKPWLGCLSVAVVVFIVALSLISHQLTTANFGADGGDLLAAVLTGGVPHPTGYPIYVLLGRLFQRIPLGSPYFRGTLLSALPVALAAGLLVASLPVAWLVLSFPLYPAPPSVGQGRSNSVAYRRVQPVDTPPMSISPPSLGKGGQGRWGIIAALIPAIIAGLAWGLSPLLLSQAVIVEVHGLQALFALLALGWAWLLLKGSSSGTKGIVLIVLAWLYGLGLGNHLTLLLFLPAIAVGLWYAWRDGLPARWVLFQCGALLLGTLVYLYLPLSARRYPPVNWGNPQTWQGFLWVVSGSPYQGYFLSAPVTDIPGRLLAWFSLLREQYGLLGLVLGAAGAVLSNQVDRRLGRLLLWVFFSYSLLALFYHTADSSVYLLPATLAWGVWIGFALWAAWPGRWRTLPWGKLLSLALFLVLLIRFPAVYRQVDPRTETRAAGFAQELLDVAPPGALVLTQSDPDTFSLWYYHFGLGWRPDVAIIAVQLTQYRWYRDTLIHTYPELTYPEGIENEENVQWGKIIPMLNPNRPICQSQVASTQPFEITYHCDFHPLPQN